MSVLVTRSCRSLGVGRTGRFFEQLKLFYFIVINMPIVWKSKFF